MVRDKHVIQQLQLQNKRTLILIITEIYKTNCKHVLSSTRLGYYNVKKKIFTSLAQRNYEIVTAGDGRKILGIVTILIPN